MRGREKASLSRRLGIIAVAALAALLALGVASPAAAKKKKKKQAVVPAVTASSASPISSGSTGNASASCTANTHVSGGGWAVSPHFDQSSTSGLRSLNTTSTAIGT